MDFLPWNYVATKASACLVGSVWVVTIGESGSVVKEVWWDECTGTLGQLLTIQSPYFSFSPASCTLRALTSLVDTIITLPSLSLSAAPSLLSAISFFSCLMYIRLWSRWDLRMKSTHSLKITCRSSCELLAQLTIWSLLNALVLTVPCN